MGGQVRFPERNALIVSMRSKGRSPDAIASALGLNKNIVLGVCFRAGLCTKDNAARGDQHGGSKLTAGEVRDIREHWVPRSRLFGTAYFAKRYSVAPLTVWKVATGKSWGHV